MHINYDLLRKNAILHLVCGIQFNPVCNTVRNSHQPWTKIEIKLHNEACS